MRDARVDGVADEVLVALGQSEGPERDVGHLEPGLAERATRTHGPPLGRTGIGIAGREADARERAADDEGPPIDASAVRRTAVRRHVSAATPRTSARQSHAMRLDCGEATSESSRAMGGRSTLAAVSFVVLSALSSDAFAAKLRECRATCAPRVEDECADLSRKKARKCRKRIVRACRRTGLEQCSPPTTTTTTVTPTSEPEPSTTTTTSTTTLPASLCGNGVIDPGEKCDGPSLGDDAPYCLRGGPVTCLSSCAGWDFSACYQCQNGIREGLEECDGDDLGGATCPVGSTGGSPVCETNCRLDYTPCIQCGDGNLDAGEFCDDGNTDAQDGCSPTCQDECGDGILEPAYEFCDDGNESNGDGCSKFCEPTPIYLGGGDETDDECALQWSVSSDVPAASTVTCADGQSPCDHGPAGDESCRFLVFFCKNNPGLHGTCNWSGVSRVALVGDSLSGAAALDDGEQSSVLGAFVSAFGFAGGVASGTNPERTVTPVVTRSDLCGQFALDVASGSSRAVAIQIEDGHVPAGIDVDEITLTCGAGG